jgi:beta-fructofuranosidase
VPGPAAEPSPISTAPEAWFADDPDRPRFHPLPAAGWTNEPHALAWRDGLWHLYFQANPNGAFWRDIVWGHQVSADLVRWERRLPALMPSTGFDRRGVWVGNWIPDRDPPAVLYTGVNGDWAGIGMAEADDDGSLTLAASSTTTRTPRSRTCATRG